ncbi:metabolite traffic protein EboE [Streptomyces sp. B1866]|uniref:metabolite traffic protein EboE n=1 Tax=Streptomyces sp. B1866 TaxID=3075431 RepID=UPI00288FD548|nr:metabolite traffic protein EboE [Streptomyces sp. B1866]MDT3397613.1 metabolite traffic protein EboE [Streptomyces sp. B1866]
MRLRHPDGSTVHLAYCTNVHPAEDLDGVLRQLARFAGPVRDRLGVPCLGVGLWLAHDVARALARDAGALARLRTELDARGLEVVTLNGFPYRGFHEPVVKRAVYAPDWSEPARLAYTLDLARVLAGLLPADAVRGSVSTLPLGWRAGWSVAREDRARRALDLLAEGLAALAARTGRTVRVGLEPEPGCAVATVRDACARLRGQVDPARVGVCLDACHLATDFEEPRASLRGLAGAGLPVVKAQLSCALQADEPYEPAVRRALARFAEPRFLHQTRAAVPYDPPYDPPYAEPEAGPRAGAPYRPVARWDDLDLALRATDDHHGPGGGAGARWRVHFHVPVHADPEPPLAATRPVLVDTVRALMSGARPVTDHLEVETYTWSVLPVGSRPADDAALVTGIAAELAWAREQLLAAGLRAPHAGPAQPDPRPVPPDARPAPPDPRRGPGPSPRPAPRPTPRLPT